MSKVLSVSTKMADFGAESNDSHRKKLDIHMII